MQTFLMQGDVQPQIIYLYIYIKIEPEIKHF